MTQEPSVPLEMPLDSEDKEAIAAEAEAEEQQPVIQPGNGDNPPPPVEAVIEEPRQQQQQPPSTPKVLPDNLSDTQMRELLRRDNEPLMMKWLDDGKGNVDPTKVEKLRMIYEETKADIDRRQRIADNYSSQLSEGEEKGEGIIKGTGLVLKGVAVGAWEFGTQGIPNAAKRLFGYKVEVDETMKNPETEILPGKPLEEAGRFVGREVSTYAATILATAYAAPALLGAAAATRLGLATSKTIAPAAKVVQRALSKAVSPKTAGVASTFIREFKTDVAFNAVRAATRLPGESSGSTITGSALERIRRSSEGRRIDTNVAKQIAKDYGMATGDVMSMMKLNNLMTKHALEMDEMERATDTWFQQFSQGAADFDKGGPLTIGAAMVMDTLLFMGVFKAAKMSWNAVKSVPTDASPEVVEKTLRELNGLHAAGINYVEGIKTEAEKLKDLVKAQSVDVSASNKKAEALKVAKEAGVPQTLLKSPSDLNLLRDPKEAWQTNRLSLDMPDTGADGAIRSQMQRVMKAIVSPAPSTLPRNKDVTNTLGFGFEHGGLIDGVPDPAPYDGAMRAFDLDKWSPKRLDIRQPENLMESFIQQVPKTPIEPKQRLMALGRGPDLTIKPAEETQSWLPTKAADIPKTTGTIDDLGASVPNRMHIRDNLRLPEVLEETMKAGEIDMSPSAMKTEIDEVGIRIERSMELLEPSARSMDVKAPLPASTGKRGRPSKMAVARGRMGQPAREAMGPADTVETPKADVEPEMPAAEGPALIKEEPVFVRTIDDLEQAVVKDEPNVTKETPQEVVEPNSVPPKPKDLTSPIVSEGERISERLIDLSAVEGIQPLTGKMTPQQIKTMTQILNGTYTGQQPVFRRTGPNSYVVAKGSEEVAALAAMAVRADKDGKKLGGMIVSQLIEDKPKPKARFRSMRDGTVNWNVLAHVAASAVTGYTLPAVLQLDLYPDGTIDAKDYAMGAAVYMGAAAVVKSLASSVVAPNRVLGVLPQSGKVGPQGQSTLVFNNKKGSKVPTEDVVKRTVQNIAAKQKESLAALTYLNDKLMRATAANSTKDIVRYQASIDLIKKAMAQLPKTTEEVQKTILGVVNNPVTIAEVQQLVNTPGASLPKAQSTIQSAFATALNEVAENKGAAPIGATALSGVIDQMNSLNISIDNMTELLSKLAKDKQTLQGIQATTHAAKIMVDAIEVPLIQKLDEVFKKGTATQADIETIANYWSQRNLVENEYKQVTSQMGVTFRTLQKDVFKNTKVLRDNLVNVLASEHAGVNSTFADIFKQNPKAGLQVLKEFDMLNVSTEMLRTFYGYTLMSMGTMGKVLLGNTMRFGWQAVVSDSIRSVVDAVSVKSTAPMKAHALKMWTMLSSVTDGLIAAKEALWTGRSTSGLTSNVTQAAAFTNPLALASASPLMRAWATFNDYLSIGTRGLLAADEFAVALYAKGELGYRAAVAAERALQSNPNLDVQKFISNYITTPPASTKVAMESLMSRMNLSRSLTGVGRNLQAVVDSNPLTKLLFSPFLRSSYNSMRDYMMNVPGLNLLSSEVRQQLRDPERFSEAVANAAAGALTILSLAGLTGHWRKTGAYVSNRQARESNVPGVQGNAFTLMDGKQIKLADGLLTQYLALGNDISEFIEKGTAGVYGDSWLETAVVMTIGTGMSLFTGDAKGISGLMNDLDATLIALKKYSDTGASPEAIDSLGAYVARRFGSFGVARDAQYLMNLEKVTNTRTFVSALMAQFGKASSGAFLERDLYGKTQTKPIGGWLGLTTAAAGRVSDSKLGDPLYQALAVHNIDPNDYIKKYTYNIGPRPLTDKDNSKLMKYVAQEVGRLRDTMIRVSQSPAQMGAKAALENILKGCFERSVIRFITNDYVDPVTKQKVSYGQLKQEEFMGRQQQQQTQTDKRRNTISQLTGKGGNR